jgi:glycosyltransferase involved in cell wall biosynthesis
MAEPLRILQLVQKPQRRGAEMFAAQLSAMLRTTGQAVVRTAYLYPNDTVGTLPLVDGDLVIGGDEASPSEKLLGANPALLRRLVAAIDDFAPDIVQANGSRTVKYAALASVFRRRVAVVYRNIGDPTQWVDDRWRRFFYSRAILPRLDGIVSVSEATLRGVQSLHATSVPTACIPRAIDVEAFQPARSRNQVRAELGADAGIPVVLYVGSLTQEKRPDRLARVFAAVRATVPEAELWVVGSGPLDDDLAGQLAISGDAAHARLLGVRDDVADLMNAADLLLLTSDTEGTPGVLLEAGAASLAVVATRVGGVADCIADGRTGVLVGREDEEGFARAAVALLRDPSARKQMGIEARYRVAESFALSAITQDYLRFYRTVLNGVGPKRDPNGGSQGNRSERRVVHVIDGLGAGGAERSLVELLPVARAAGWASTVVCLHRRGEGVQSDAIRRGEDVRFLEARSLPQRVRALRRVLDDVGPDLVHSTLFAATVVARLACRDRRAPLLTSLVNTPYATARLGDPNINVFSIRALRTLDRAMSRWTDRFHAITGAVADAAVHDLGIPRDRITVIPRGRDARRLGAPTPTRRAAARRSLGIGAATPLVVTVGRHEYQKGQVHLLRAATRVFAVHPDAVVLVAGRDGAASAELRRMHAELGLGDRVRFLGHRDDVPELLAAADVFVFPSLYEGLGGALIEAMALRLPVVASDIPAVREVVEDGATADLVPPGDPIALGDALVRLLGDADRMRAYGDRGGRRFEAEYTLATSTTRMLALYDEVGRDGARGRRRPWLTASR